MWYSTSTSASLLQLLGAGGFGLLVGWYIYYINRYRQTAVHLSDLVTLLSVIGGASVLALFPARSDLFGAYGIGLCVGFFSYFAVLLVLVKRSANFDLDWFLDGRRKQPQPPYFVPTGIDTPPLPPMQDTLAHRSAPPIQDPLTRAPVE